MGLGSHCFCYVLLRSGFVTYPDPVARCQEASVRNLLSLICENPTVKLRASHLSSSHWRGRRRKGETETRTCMCSSSKRVTVARAYEKFVWKLLIEMEPGVSFRKKQ
jgi:hypothetical protein